MPSILRALLTNNAQKCGESFFAPLSGTRKRETGSRRDMFHSTFKTTDKFDFDDTQAVYSSVDNRHTGHRSTQRDHTSPAEQQTMRVKTSTLPSTIA